MIECTTTSHDDVPLKYVYSTLADSNQWIALLIPFGLTLAVTEPFFAYFAQRYNVVSLESRLILAPAEQALKHGQLSVDNHVADLLTILDQLQIEKSILVGYCSGAGIALMAANQHPERFDNLILANGEYTLLNKSSCVTQFGNDVDSLFTIAAKSEKNAQLVLSKIQADSPEQVNSPEQANSPEQVNSIPEGINYPFSQPHYFYRYAVNYLAYKQTNFEHQAQQIKQQTLLISGQQDLQTNANSSAHMKNLIDHAQLFIDPQGDHYELLRAQSNALIKIGEHINTECGFVSPSNL